MELSFIPLGGIGTVTKNMYLYEFGNEILIVDCGMGFADITMPGVDLLIPDVTYLKNTNKKIVGMVLSHGHEDHIGGLPFVLPQLQQKFPIYGSTLTSALANEKLVEFGIKTAVQTVNFTDSIKLGQFEISLIRMTHSILDAGNIVIKTPIGNMYHGSDFKFDFTPVDGKPSDLGRIAAAGNDGILCLLSDCLGANRAGHSRSEQSISESFSREFKKAQGKIFVTTYSSNISRLNQAIQEALKLNKKICIMGRSLLKSRDIGRQLKYMDIPKNAEIKPQDVRRYKPNEVLILVAGSQAQEESGLVRIASGEDRDLRISPGDLVIFSADPIPGNETNINSLIDTIAKQGAQVIYSEVTSEFHVSGHGAENDLKLLISLTRPKFLLPIGGTYRQMVAYREIARDMGYKDNAIILAENGREYIFSQNAIRPGRKIAAANIYVDQVSGEAVDSYVVIDRLKISKEGVLIIIVEISIDEGKLNALPDIITKGFVYEKKDFLAKKISEELIRALSRKDEKMSSWAYYKKIIERTAEQIMYREGRREPLIVPVVLEV